MQPTSYTKFRKVCSLLRVTCKFEKAKFGPRTGKADWGEGGVRVQNPQNPEKSCSRDDDRKWRPDRRETSGGFGGGGWSWWWWWRWQAGLPRGGCFIKGYF